MSNDVIRNEINQNLIFFKIIIFSIITLYFPLNFKPTIVNNLCTPILLQPL